MKKIVNFLKLFLSGNHKLNINDGEVMATNLNRSVTKINDAKHNNLMERKRDIVLKTDMLLEETKKSAKNIGYLINGFWPKNQEKFSTGGEKDNATKAEINSLTKAYNELEDLKKEIRDLKNNLELSTNKSQLESVSNEEKDKKTSLAKKLNLKTNIMTEHLKKFKLPDKI